ncbi:MAG: hypothetical protein GC168_10075 [Candidatus Hydrogenedens sp.]|nr:hypothetical protein [Candidatus Hydrogenedens sp.]
MKLEGIAVQQLRAAAAPPDADAPKPGTARAVERPPQEAAAVKPSEEQVRRPERAPESAPRAPSSKPRISVDEASNRLIAQVVDQNNEVIKQFPPEAILQFTARFRKLQGLLFDESV